MPLTAEQLPAEIWLSVFTFLEGHDLVRAFSPLNSHFDSLLRSPHLLIHVQIKLRESNQRLPVQPWSQLPLEQISTLSVGQRRGHCLIQFLRWNAPHLSRVHTVSLYFRRSKLYENVQFVTFALQQLPALRNIRIKYTARNDPRLDYFRPLFAFIFNAESAIERCAFYFSDYNHQPSTEYWSVNPSMRLLVNDDAAWMSLTVLLALTPQLRSLRTQLITQDIRSFEHICLPHLTRVTLSLQSSQFALLEQFKKATPNLQSLQLRGTFEALSGEYLDENSWRRLFEKIERYRVNLSSYTYGESNKITLRERFIRHLNGKSWFTYTDNTSLLCISIKFLSMSN